MTTPCYNCINRSSTCHSTCKTYLEYRNNKNIENDKINKNKYLNNSFYEYKEEKFKRINKRLNH